MKADTPESLPVTEQENPNTWNLSSLSSASEIVHKMNQEDALVAAAVAKELPVIAHAVEEIVTSSQQLRPAFLYRNRHVRTAGSAWMLPSVRRRLEFRRIWSRQLSRVDMKRVIVRLKHLKMTLEPAAPIWKQRGFTKADVLVGIAASGRTPYTVGAITYARSTWCVYDSLYMCA